MNVPRLFLYIVCLKFVASIADDLLIESRSRANDSMFVDHELRRLRPMTSSGLATSGLSSLSGLATTALSPTSHPLLRTNVDPDLSHLSKSAAAIATLPRRNATLNQQLRQQQQQQQLDNSLARIRRDLLRRQLDSEQSSILDSLGLETTSIRGRPISTASRRAPTVAAVAQPTTATTTTTSVLGNRNRTLMEGLQLAGVASPSLMEELGLIPKPTAPKPNVVQNNLDNYIAAAAAAQAAQAAQQAASQSIAPNGISNRTLEELGLGHLIPQRASAVTKQQHLLDALNAKPAGSDFASPSADIVSGIAARRGLQLKSLGLLPSTLTTPTTPARRGSLDALIGEVKKRGPPVKPLVGLKGAK